VKKLLLAAAAAALAVSMMAAVSTAAVGSPAAVVRAGACSKTSLWRLTLNHDHGRIEVQAEVQTAFAAQRWRSRFSDDGAVFGHAGKTTLADGSFTVTRFTTNQAGRDLITVRSKSLVTAEVCRASATTF
jgi:opacity protein-like surface antigen